MDAKDRELMLRVLRKCERMGTSAFTGHCVCPLCLLDDGHAPDCELAAAIEMLQPVEVPLTSSARGWPEHPLPRMSFIADTG